MSAASFVPSSVKPFGIMNSSFMYAQLIQIGKRLLQLLMRSEISRLISIMWWQSFVLDFLIKLIPSFESCCILDIGRISGIERSPRYSIRMMSFIFR